ncbi:MAG: hypothetical protein HPY60_11185 [Candidatus Methanofastidiosum sp.]|nr:hypothetical protein [Methanofastidiosum sp.]
MKSDSDEYPYYLVDATNEMFMWLSEFLSHDKEHAERISGKSYYNINTYKISKALKRLKCDENFLNDFIKTSGIEWESLEIYYLQNEHMIRTIEEKILIRGGMYPEAARFILEEATKLIKTEWPSKKWPSKIERVITPRRVFCIIGGAAIIALNATSGLNEPAIQISYALGAVLMDKA